MPAKLNSCQFFVDAKAQLAFVFHFRMKSHFQHCTVEAECVTLDEVCMQINLSRAVFSVHVHASASA